MGSFRVPTAIEKRVTLCTDGRTLGPYFRNRSRASESLSPAHDFDLSSTVDASVTSASDSYDRAFGVRDHAVGECPGNVGCRPT